MTEVPQYNIIADELAAETTRFDNAIKASRRQLEQLRSAIPEKRPHRIGRVYLADPTPPTDATLSREPADASKKQKINAERALKAANRRALTIEFVDIDHA